MTLVFRRHAPAALRGARRVVRAGRFTALAPLEWRLPRSPSAIKSAERRQLSETLRHAYEHVPYYRETLRKLGLQPADFAVASDLAKLPLIDREQLQRDPEYFTSRAEPLSSYTEIDTSGSTGRPMAFFRYVPGAFQKSLGFERMEPLLAGLTGKRWSRRDAVIVPTSRWSADMAHAGQVQWLSLHSRVICRSFSLFDTPAELASEIEQFRPDLIKGNGSFVEELYTHVMSEGRAFHHPKVITYTGDSVSAPMSRVLRNELGIALLSVYQAVEIGIIGWQCERQGGHHLNVDLFPVRILGSDRRELPHGESGEVVVSNLVNRGTMLLNYLLGDLATRSPEPCECGRSLPLLSGIDGRSTDWLQSASGRLLHPRAVTSTVLRQIWPGIRRYQVVQERPGHIRVLIVTAPGGDHEEIRSSIVAEARKLEDPLDADVVFTDSLSRTEGGKVRTVVRNDGDS